MATVIGYIYPNEGFSCQMEGGTPWNQFMVNISSIKIPVTSTKTRYMDYLIKFQNPQGAWSDGYIEGAFIDPGEDYVRDYCAGLNSPEVRLYNNAGLTGAVVKCRYLSNRFKPDGVTLITPSIPSASELLFGDGTCGASKPYLMAVTHFKAPGTTTWVKVDPNSSYGWIDTQCRTNGYMTAWGIDHARN